jgi:hypothetical protein
VPKKLYLETVKTSGLVSGVYGLKIRFLSRWFLRFQDKVFGAGV